MRNSNKINIVLEKTVAELIKIYNDKLKSVILYGSFARGDSTDESDIDIFILVDIEQTELAKYRTQLVKFAIILDLEYDIILSLHDQDCSTFNKWRNILPFYKNIVNEGVVLHA